MNSNKAGHILAIAFLTFGLFTSDALASAEDQPFIVVVNLPTNMFSVYGFPIGTIITATADDPSTVGVDFSDSQPTGDTNCDFWGATCAIFFLPNPILLEPFWTITATDGTQPLEFVLADLELTGWNLQADTLSGTVQPWNPNTDEVRFAVMKPAWCSPQNETASVGASGVWTAYLAPCDLVAGAGGALNYFSGKNKQIGSWGVPSHIIYLPFISR